MPDENADFYCILVLPIYTAMLVNKNACLRFEYDASQRCYLYTEDWKFDIPISPAAIKMMHMLLH
jgi:hypothetical protein